MSMIRSPVVYAGEPLHNTIPALGKAFWYKLRASATNGVGTPGVPPLTKTVTGSVSGSEYTDPTLYQFPTDNDTAVNSVCWSVTEDVDDLYLDSVLTLVGMEADEQIIVACDVAYVEQGTTSGSLWVWGRPNGTASHIGLHITSAEVPTFVWRPKDGGTNNTQALTADSGSTFAAFKAQGRFAVVCSLRVIDSTHVAVSMLIGNGTLTGAYSYASIDVASGGSANPGISGGVSMANFGGLGIGCRHNSPGTGFENLWGRGAANVGRYDQIIGWRGAYDAALAAAVLAEMTTTHRLDFPPSLCRAV